MLFGKRLLDVRRSKGHTQESLGELLSVAKQQVYRWEKGENEPSAEQLANLSSALEVSVDFLLGLVEHPTSHVTEDALTPMERRLISAVRSGAVIEAIEATIALSKDAKEANVTTG